MNKTETANDAGEIGKKSKELKKEIMDQFRENNKVTEHVYENLVLEGGGNKGIPYCGAIRVLEEIGILKGIQRYAGTRWGALVSMLLVIGYTAPEIEVALTQELSDNVLLGGFAVTRFLTAIPRLLSAYGYSNGESFVQWMGKKLSFKKFCPDLTFQQLYRETGKELCIVVVNLNANSEEYCHPKTTPDMPIRIAVRMSMSMPGMFQPVRYSHVAGQTNDWYVDGGVICHYPVHCYDGWWLSMKPEDNFLYKLNDFESLPEKLCRSEKFAGVNEKTIGILLFSENEADVFKYHLNNAAGGDPLSISYEACGSSSAREHTQRRKIARLEEEKIINATDQFLKVFQKHNLDPNGEITYSEFESVLRDKDFSNLNAQLLFGRDLDPKELFDHLDQNKNGLIEVSELFHHIEMNGLCIEEHITGNKRLEIDGFLSFARGVILMMVHINKQAFVKAEDMQRTIGINTGHIEADVNDLDIKDIKFLIQQGRLSTMMFFKKVSNQE